MEEQDLLDDAKIRQDVLILEMVQWWEKRRLLYNFIVGVVGLVAVFMVLNQNSYIAFSEILLFAILPYGFAANVFYLFGWVTELLIRYYFKITLSPSVRQVLFWIGTCISIVPFILAFLILIA